MQEHCMQGKWLQLHGIREWLGLEGNLVISSSPPISLFPAQESSFESKYRNNYPLLMTILTPERDGVINKIQGWFYSSKSDPTSTGMCVYTRLKPKLCLTLSIFPCPLWNTLCGQEIMPWEDTSFLWIRNQATMYKLCTRGWWVVQ